MNTDHGTQNTENGKRSPLFYGIGGGSSEDPRMLRHHERLVSLARERNGDDVPVVLTLPTAHHNGLHADLRHRDFFVERFLELDCEVVEILLGEIPEGQRNTSRVQILDWLEEADLLFVLGGDTRYLLQQVRDLDLEEVFKEAFDQGVIFSGSSAGCIWIAEFSMSDSEEYHSPDDWDYITLDGLGFMPAMNVHDNQGVRKGLRSGLSRKDAFDKIASEAGLEKAICVDEFAAVMIEGSNPPVCINFGNDGVELWARSVNGGVERKSLNP